jgi:tryptophanyl-tRNA synthetase
MKKTALSGIQTSGDLHLGNYLGSIKNWLTMQDHYDCFFFLADLHSITVEQDPTLLKKSRMSAAALYLACGLDPEKSAIFLQSSIKEHTHLAWMLNCLTPYGWLKRMTQFKDKAGANQDQSSVGLFTYPVLMAADILLYQADVVPVGDDQKQHLELTRDIAMAVNRRFDEEIFNIPEPLIQGVATRIMSLKDGTKKMSKSDPSDLSRINLIDEPDLIRKKLQKSKTDSSPEITYLANERPDIANLLNIFSSLTNEGPEEIAQRYASGGFAKFKNDLADVVINELQPIRAQFLQLIQDQNYLASILERGKDRAQDVASKTCDKLSRAFGLL